MSQTERVPRLRAARVVRVEEHACDVVREGQRLSARFAPIFPTPRVARVSPGHLVALAAAADGAEVVVWRWYDAVVLSGNEAGSVRLWEPGHGEVLARARETYVTLEPGLRAFASAGLPGADWRVACPAAVPPERAEVELDAVHAFFDDHDLWPATLADDV